MHERHFPGNFFLCGLALLLAGTAAWAENGCPSLSGCSYQAGQGLPGQNPVSPRPSTPGVQPPVILNSCDAGGCLDPDGTRYNGRNTDSENRVFLDPQGRRCVRSGEHLQCG